MNYPPVALDFSYCAVFFFPIYTFFLSLENKVFLNRQLGFLHSMHSHSSWSKINKNNLLGVGLIFYQF